MDYIYHNLASQDLAIITEEGQKIEEPEKLNDHKTKSVSSADIWQPHV